MSEIKTWCISFCSILVIISVMRFVVPDCKIKKVSDSALSLIIVLIMFIPFADKNQNILSDFDYGLSERDEKFQENSQYELALEKYITDTLAGDGINIDKIEVLIEIDAEGYINIEKIEILISNSEDIEKAKNIIKNKCELDLEKVVIS